MDNEEIIELALGAENLRRMFRQTMANHARLPGESLVQTASRLARDPATAKVAKTLGCSVRELLDGFGKEELFYVDEGYDRETAEREVGDIVEKIAGAALGTNDPRISDVLEKSSAGKSMTAPHVEAKRGKVIGDDVAKKQIALAFHKHISRRR